MNKEIKCISIFAPIRNRKLLLTRRNENPRKGYFNFIGGHSFEGESIISAAKREVKEEVGAEIIMTEKKVIQICGLDNTKLEDDYFIDIDEIGTYVKGFTIKEIHITSDIIASTVEGFTTYNLFIGDIKGTPAISDEVLDFKWDYIKNWVRRAKHNEIKIQPVDYLCLLYLLKKQGIY